MCSSSNDVFPKFSIEDLFFHCDDVCLASNLKSKPNIGDNLLHYLAWSSSQTFKAEECYEAMLNRRTPYEPQLRFGYDQWEFNIFANRFKLLESNNKAFELATRVGPSVAALEDFSNIDPCFSTLFPVKRFIADHPELASAYRGMLPFGREVIACYNYITPPEYAIKGSPSFRDHIRLRDISNKKALLMGMPSITINNLMYQIGRNIKDKPKEAYVVDLNDII